MKKMNKLNQVLTHQVIKYPEILNQKYFFVFNNELSVLKYDESFQELATTTSKATKFLTLIEYLQLKSISVPIIIIPKKKYFNYNEQEIKLIKELKARKIKYVTIKIANKCNTLDQMIYKEFNEFKFYHNTINNCLPVLNKLKETWTIVD